jgi:chromosome segregation ATPase
VAEEALEEPEEPRRFEEVVNPKLAKAEGRKNDAEARFEEVKEGKEKADLQRAANMYRRKVEAQTRANRAEQRKFERVADRKRVEAEKKEAKEQNLIKQEKMAEQKEVDRLEGRKEKLAKKMEDLEKRLKAAEQAVNDIDRDKALVKNPEDGLSEDELKEIRELADDRDREKVDAELAGMKKRTKELDRQRKKPERELKKLRDKQQRMREKMGDLEEEIGTHQQRIGELGSWSMEVVARLEGEIEQIDGSVDDKRAELQQRIERIKTEFGAEAAAIGDLLLADGRIRNGLARWLEEKRDARSKGKDEKALGRAGDKKERANDRYKSVEKRVNDAAARREKRLKGALNNELRVIFEGRQAELAMEYDVDEEAAAEDAADQAAAAERRKEINAEREEIGEQRKAREGKIAKLKEKIDSPVMREKLARLEKEAAEVAEGEPNGAQERLDALGKQVDMLESMVRTHERALKDLEEDLEELNAAEVSLDKEDAARTEKRGKRETWRVEREGRAKQLEQWYNNTLAKIDGDAEFRWRFMKERRDYFREKMKEEVNNIGELALAA